MFLADQGANLAATNFFLTGHVLMATGKRAQGSGREAGVARIQFKDGLQTGLHELDPVFDLDCHIWGSMTFA